MMSNKEILEQIDKLIQKKMSEEFSGHDYFHIRRVYQMALRLQALEGGNSFVISLASLLHDLDDYKLTGYDDDCYQAVAIMEELGVDLKTVKQVQFIINNLSFHKSKTNIINSIESKIVQDADRLDALGAIGIARTFAYGGKHHRLIYDPSSTTNSLQHFNDKLLKIKDLIHTQTAKKIAEERHSILVKFKEDFLKEWEAL